jgi:TonB family protein
LRDEQHRCTAEDILRRLQPAATTEAKNVELHAPPDRSNRWVVVTIVVAALLLGVWLGIRVLSHQASVPAANTGAATDAPAEKSPAPFSEKQQPAKKGVTRGSVFQQVMPEISRGAQNTITGRIKVSAQVEVDASGKVSQAKLVSAGPSRYFADRALAAARRWKFTPPQVDGRPVASEWLLRFQIGRASTQAFPVETKP